MRTVTIEITAEDIAQNEKPRNDTDYRCLICPVARAMSRAFGEPVSVTGCQWRFDRFDSHDYYSLPTVARAAVHLLDQSRPVQPFTFPVEVP